MLEIHGLNKRYGKTVALRSLDCKLETGVYGLVGPNGSGKTTLMNILTANLKSDGGTVLFDGREVGGNDKAFRRQIGYMPQYCGMIPGFTVWDFLGYMAALKGLERKQAALQIEALLGRFFSEDVKDQKISSLSGGMKQRVMLIQAFLGVPKLVLLDEPTAGLDPMQRMNVKNFIAENACDKTILIATHIISDVESIAKELICLEKGVCIFKGAPGELALKADGMVWRYADVPGEALMTGRRVRILSARGEGSEVCYRLLAPQKPFPKASPLPPTPEDAYALLYGERYEADTI